MSQDHIRCPFRGLRSISIILELVLGCCLSFLDWRADADISCGPARLRSSSVRLAVCMLNIGSWYATGMTGASSKNRLPTTISLRKLDNLLPINSLCRYPNNFFASSTSSTIVKWLRPLFLRMVIIYSRAPISIATIQIFCCFPALQVVHHSARSESAFLL